MDQITTSPGPICDGRAMNPDDIIILIDPYRHIITYVALDIPHLYGWLRAAHPGKLSIGGEAAKLFYLAAAGREFDEPPEMASLARATIARFQLELARKKSTGPMLHILVSVIERNYQGKIDPWLGTTKLDAAGRIITEAG